MILLAKLGVGILGGALVGAVALSSEGFIGVRVDERQPDGTHLNLLVPALLATTAFDFVPDHDLTRGADQLRPYLPIIDAAIPALADSADGVLVEVVDATDHVLITKCGRSIVVDVSDEEDVVHVSVPLRAAHSAIHRIQEANPGN
jgi:hypothetical protein